jgi:predicted component of type VI protein secretion system
MQVTLRVVGGKNDGRDIKIAVPRFIIGRGEQAHLRPSSDLISRQHCAINIADGKVTIEDLGSRNGTFVNEEPLNGAHVAKVGDVLKVGRLQFEVLIDYAKPGVKKPRVETVAEAAKRSATKTPGNSNLDEDSITEWLSQPTEMPEPSVSETRQFKLDETAQLYSENEPGKSDSSEPESTISDISKDKTSGLFKKKKPGKLPPKPKFSSETSTTAADDVLKKFFNRR